MLDKLSENTKTNISIHSYINNPPPSIQDPEKIEKIDKENKEIISPVALYIKKISNKILIKLKNNKNYNK